MSNKKAGIVIISVRVKKFPVFILLPLRCLSEVIEGAQDLLSLFTRVTGKVWKTLYAVENALMLFRANGPLDFVDVDIKNADAYVKVKVLLR